MTALASYSTGLATVGAGGTTVTGTSTIWSGTNVKPGDIFQIGNFQSVISDVTDTTHLIIPPWGGGAQTGVAYTIWKVSPQRFAGSEAMATVNELVAAFNTSGYFVFVDIDETEPDPSLGDDGQYAFQPTTGKTWVKIAGVWTFLGIYKGFNLTGAWDSGTDYVVGDVVSLDGASYVCVLDHTNHTPPNTTYWQLLASKGDAGATGAKGDVAGIKLTYSTTTADADPGAGVFRLNNATPASATAAYIDNTQVGGASITAILDTWDDSTGTTKGYVRFEKTTDPTVWAQFRMTGSVVDGTGYRKLTLANGAGSGAFTNADTFAVTFSRAGDTGPGDVTAANNGSEFNAASFATTLSLIRYAAQTLTAAQKAQARANLDVLKKNYLLNSAMMVSQENGTTAGSAPGYFPVDQFAVNYGTTSAVYSAAQVASVTPGGSPNRLRVTVTTADAVLGGSDIVWIDQKIEGLRAGDLLYGSASAKTVTVQFGVKAPAGTYSVTFLNAAQNRSYVAEYTISGPEANTDVTKSVTIPGDQTGVWAKDNTVGLWIRWGLMAGSGFQQAAGSWQATNVFGSPNQFNLMGTNGNVFELFDVGLYEGSAAPSFQLPDLDDELRKCKRYWRKSYEPETVPGTATTAGLVAGGMNDASATGHGAVNFDVPMRVAPSVNYWDGAGNASKMSYPTSNTSTWNHNATINPGIFNVSKNGFSTGGPNAVPHVQSFIHYTASARL